MIGLSVTIKGDEKVRRGLRVLTDGIKDRTVLHKRLGRVGVRWVQQNFQRQGQPRWKRLMPATIARKGSSRILEDKGRLRGAFDSEANKVKSLIGNPLVYSGPHEKGAKDLPKRKMLPTEKQARLEIVIPTTQQYVDELIKKGGL